MDERLKHYDFRRAPFRGIFTQIAKEFQISRQAIHRAVQVGKPAILDRVFKLIELRQGKPPS